MRIAKVLSTVLVASVIFSGCFLGYRYNRNARYYAGQIPLTLVNDLPVSACYVHMGPSADRNWGDDWLAPNETIPSGSARTFAVMGSPTWDIQVQNCQHQVLAEVHQLPVTQGMQLTLSQLQQPLQYAQPPQPTIQPPPPGQMYIQPSQKIPERYLSQ